MRTEHRLSACVPSGHVVRCLDWYSGLKTRWAHRLKAYVPREDKMKRACFCLVALVAANSFAADWRTAEPGWRYEFPRDHHAHRGFKTEWWYFTGNLFDND